MNARERWNRWLAAVAALLPQGRSGPRAAAAAGGEIPVRLMRRDWTRSPAPAASASGIDQPLLWVVVALLSWGLVMVYSASVALPDNPRFASYSPYHFVLRHALAIGIGAVAGVIAFQVPTSRWQTLANPLFLVAIALLVIVLVPFIGKGVNGARRWIPLGVMN